MSRSRSKTGDRLPRTTRGRETLESLLRGAETVFRERGYEAASVSAICRYTSVAQGTFYLYFTNKEDAYVRVVARLEDGLLARLKEAVAIGPSASERLLRAYDALLDFICENVSLFQVFREAEFVRPEIPKRFYTAACDELSRIVRAGVADRQFRSTDGEIVAYAVLGMVFFLALRYVIWGVGAVPAAARCVGADLLLRGIDPGSRRSVPLASIFLAPRESEDATLKPAGRPEGGEATRRALLVAAERAFGQAGFHRTSISTITYLAGVAQGTFYVHFASKVAVFNELVREIGRQFRRRQSLAVAGYGDRRAVEAVGLCSFFRWIKDHPGAYRILREAEFVDDHVGKWHYQRLAEGYARGLAVGMERGEIRQCDLEALSYVMQGIAHLSGQRWVLWGEPDKAEGEVLPALIGFILHGVGGESDILKAQGID